MTNKLHAARMRLLVRALEYRATVQAESKRQAMIYQRDKKIRVARENGVPDETYFDLPYVKWEKIRDKG